MNAFFALLLLTACVSASGTGVPLLDQHVDDVEMLEHHLNELNEKLGQDHNLERACKPKGKCCDKEAKAALDAAGQAPQGSFEHAETKAASQAGKCREIYNFPKVLCTREDKKCKQAGCNCIVA